jgi:hypothetical protein
LERDPENELLLRASSSSLGGSLGSDPVSLLKLRSSLLKLGNELKEFGRNPVKELWEMSNDSKDLSLVMD